jgi:transposase
MWPGNTADVTTLIPVIERLRRRFDIARMCVVADRGMISAATMAEWAAQQHLRQPRNYRQQLQHKQLQHQ